MPVGFISEDDGGKIKPHGFKSTLTKEQNIEFFKCFKSYSYFIRNYVKVRSLKKGPMLFYLYDYQEKLLDS